MPPALHDLPPGLLYAIFMGLGAASAALAGPVRLAERLGLAGQEMLPAIGRYLHSIATEEFPAMSLASRHPATQQAAEALERAAHAAAATLPDRFALDLLDETNQVEAAREARLQAAAAGLPAQFWTLILLLAGLIVATGPLYPARAHVVAMRAVRAAGLGAHDRGPRRAWSPRCR